MQTGLGSIAELKIKIFAVVNIGYFYCVQWLYYSNYPVGKYDIISCRTGNFRFEY